MRHFTTGDIRLLKELWPNHPLRKVAKIMGRAETSIKMHADRNGLKRISCLKLRQPPAEQWIRIATASAEKYGVPADHVLRGKPTRRAAWARWKAWEEILASNDNYSVAGVGRVSGHDHGTILRGLKQIGSRK